MNSSTNYTQRGMCAGLVILATPPMHSRFGWEQKFQLVLSKFNFHNACQIMCVAPRRLVIMTVRISLVPFQRLVRLNYNFFLKQDQKKSQTYSQTCSLLKANFQGHVCLPHLVYTLCWNTMQGSNQPTALKVLLKRKLKAFWQIIFSHKTPSVNIPYPLNAIS